MKVTRRDTDNANLLTVGVGLRIEDQEMVVIGQPCQVGVAPEVGVEDDVLR